MNASMLPSGDDLRAESVVEGFFEEVGCIPTPDEVDALSQASQAWRE
jgi:hypothetical protein